MFKIFFRPVGKRSVVVVDIKNIAGYEIVGNIDILPSIVVDIAGRGRMTEATKHYAGLYGNVMKHGMPQAAVHIVAKQPAHAMSRVAVAQAENGGAVAIRG